MSTIFSKIISGEIPCHKIAENEHFLAFLDVMPLVEGHVLVVPKVEIDYIFDMAPDQLADMMKFAQSVAPAIRKAIPCKRIGVAVIGLEVPHAHVHLVPMTTANDLNFTRAKLQVSQESLAKTADLIRSFL
ncbi:HIT family protein [Aquirufa aurantiipilula]|uniref:HIT family protein n=1 Tax=Aquirufa aurantiipilula TaxID=2696561 RepID=A0ABT6BGN0_9BACT|nr:HIT family protein [Aquirufa aurantiipilula]MDF5689612.1 HIT family protein [Aquirufa aurantiipilula]